MQKFTKFEHQYIMVLALQAKENFDEAMKNQEAFTQVDPNISKYMEVLESIAIKARDNIKLERKNA